MVAISQRIMPKDQLYENRNINTCCFAITFNQQNQDDNDNDNDNDNDMTI